MKQHDNDCIPWGGETVVHNGEVIGTVTSSAFNFQLGHPVCLGFIEKQVETFDENLEINIAGTMYPVQVVKDQ
jgi:pyruvate dehydrogenase phosphatase regulatory subunit/4-methylaminobutanoate oxidase (formaldehyde-forming)